MRKLIIALLTVMAVASANTRASAWWCIGPCPQTAAFPMANPPGWYTNTYYFAWQYPWFAYYGYNAGPYANWAAGGGFATYANYTGHPVMYRPYLNLQAPPPAPAEPKDKKDVLPKDKQPEAGKVVVNLPADAKLLFNGALASGTGSVRTFRTPELLPGMDYGYDLTAEVIRDGKSERLSGRVIVRAGLTTTITLTPDVIQTAGK